MSFSFKQLQEENAAWVIHNFGETTPDLAWRPLMGMCEELSELIVAHNTEEFVDGISDCVVFMADYCNAKGFDLQDLWDAKVPSPPLKQLVGGPASDTMLLIIIGKLQHHHLKSVQGIRGGNDHHLEAAKSLLSTLLYALDMRYRHSSVTLSFIEQVEKVWVEVRKRDWTKHKKEGVDAAG